MRLRSSAERDVGKGEEVDGVLGRKWKMDEVEGIG